MTLKDHSAQSIFESLMLDPNLEVQEGQTREEAAKHEAEFRSRQHWNNMRALALGTGEADFEKSPIRALADFISRPQAFFTEHMPDILKMASIGEVTSSSHYQFQVPDSQKLHANDKSEALSPESEKFLQILMENNMPHQGVEYIKAMAKNYRRTDSGKENPDGWIKTVAKGLGHNTGLMQALSLPQNGGMSPQAQTNLSHTLYTEHGNSYHFTPPAPKASTLNSDFHKAGRYGSNSKKELESPATVQSVNNALNLMGRDERVELGSTNKLKFKSDLGNVQQWKAYKEGGDNQKRVRIFQNHINPSLQTQNAPITNADMGNYTVAEILRGFFHHVDEDNGQHDVTAGQEVKLQEEAAKVDEQWEEASETPLDPEIEKDMAPIGNDEFEFYFGGELKGTQKWDTNTPIKLFHHGVHEEYTSLAVQHGLCDGRGYMKPEHVQGIMQAAKAKVLGKNDLVKHTTKSGKVVYSLAHKPQKIDPKTGEVKLAGGLHKYINYLKNPPAIIPPKTAEKLIENATESSGLGFNSTEDALDNDGTVSQEAIDAALDATGESQPVQTHPNEHVNHMNLLTNQLKHLASLHMDAYNPTQISKTSQAPTAKSASLKGSYSQNAALDFVQSWNNLPSETQVGISGQLHGLITNLLDLNPSLLPAYAAISTNAGGPWNMSNYMQSLKNSPDQGSKAQYDKALALSMVMSQARALTDKNVMEKHEDAHNKPAGNAEFHVKMAQTLTDHMDDYINKAGSDRDMQRMHPLALQHLLEGVESFTSDDDKKALHPVSQAIGNHIAGINALQEIKNPMSVKAFLNHVNSTYNELDSEALDAALSGISEPTPAADLDYDIHPSVLAELAVSGGDYASTGFPFDPDASGGGQDASTMNALMQHSDNVDAVFESMMGDNHPFKDAFAQMPDSEKQAAFNDIYSQLQTKSQTYALDSLAEANGKSYKDFNIADATQSEQMRMKQLYSIMHSNTLNLLKDSGSLWHAELAIMTQAQAKHIIKDYINATHNMKSIGDPNSIKSVFATPRNAMERLTTLGDVMSPDEVEHVVNSAMSDLGTDITHASNALGLTDALKNHLKYAADNLMSPHNVDRTETPLHNWEMTTKPDGQYAKAHMTAMKHSIHNLAAQHANYPNDADIHAELVDKFGKAHAAGVVTDMDVEMWKKDGLTDDTIKQSIDKQYGGDMSFGYDSGPEFGTPAYTENKLKEAAQNFDSTWANTESGMAENNPSILNSKADLHELIQTAIDEGMDASDVVDIVSAELKTAGADMEIDFPEPPSEGYNDPMDGEFEDLYEEEDEEPEVDHLQEAIDAHASLAKKLPSGTNFGIPKDMLETANEYLQQAKDAPPNQQHDLIVRANKHLVDVDSNYLGNSHPKGEHPLEVATPQREVSPHSPEELQKAKADMLAHIKEQNSILKGAVKPTNRGIPQGWLDKSKEAIENAANDGELHQAMQEAHEKVQNVQKYYNKNLHLGRKEPKLKTPEEGEPMHPKPEPEPQPKVEEPTPEEEPEEVDAEPEEEEEAEEELEVPEFEPDEDEDDQQENIDIELPDADLEDEEEPEVEEPPSVEDELDTVDDAADSIDRQKAEIMQEVFGRDQDSSDAKKYSKFLDKQKPEKIDSLHEKHVIGNIEKKALKAKADKVKQKVQAQKDEEKAAAKEETDKAKADEKQQKEEDKTSQKEADALPHKSSEIDKKIKDGQDAKQMARENMIHQHQHEDNMSPKTQKDYEEAHNKFEAAGVDMDELIAEKDEHGDKYGSEEHLTSAMDKDAKQQDEADHYDKHISSDNYEHRKNRENSFRAGQPGKFTEFDEEGNPSKDLHHKLDQYGESSLQEHEHGKGPEKEKVHSETGEELGEGTAHSEGGKADEDALGQGPPDPEVARRKMSEGYIWHEETRSWMLKENMKTLNGNHGPKGASMIHGGSSAGTKPGQMVKPFALNEDGSTSDNHFVVSHAGVHKVGTPSAKPGSFSSNQHTTEAALGHALKDTKTGPGGVTHLGNDALGLGGTLGNTGLGTASNHINSAPKPKGMTAAAGANIGGAIDKLKDMLNLEDIEESAVDKLYVKYK